MGVNLYTVKKNVSDRTIAQLWMNLNRTFTPSQTNSTPPNCMYVCTYVLRGATAVFVNFTVNFLNACYILTKLGVTFCRTFTTQKSTPDYIVRTLF